MTERPSEWVEPSPPRPPATPPTTPPTAPAASPAPLPPAPAPGGLPTPGPPAPRWGQYAPGTDAQVGPERGGGQWGGGQWGGGQWGQPRYGQYGQYGQGPAAGQPVGFGGPPQAPRPGIVPLRPLGLGELLDGAFRAIRTNPRVMFGLSAVVVTFTALLQALMTWRIFADLEATLVQTTGPDGALVDVDAALGDLVSQLGTALGAQTVASVVTTILSGLLIVSVSQSVLGRTASLSEVWTSAKGQVLRLLALSLVVFLVVASPALVWGGLIAASAVTEQWGLLVAVLVLGGLAVMAAIAFLVTKTALATPALMLERTTITRALQRGWALTRGTFWRVLGIYLLTSLLVSVVAGAISGSVSVFLQFTASDPTALLSSPAYLVGTTLAQIVAATLTTPFTAAVIALLYIDVRMRTEGLDIELARAAEQGD